MQGETEFRRHSRTRGDADDLFGVRGRDNGPVQADAEPSRSLPLLFSKETTDGESRLEQGAREKQIAAKAGGKPGCAHPRRKLRPMPLRVQQRVAHHFAPRGRTQF